MLDAMAPEAFVECPTDNATQPLDMTSIQLLEWAARQAPDVIAVKQPAEGFAEELTWTFAELLADARRLAAFLSSRFAHGDHVAMWAANSGPWPLYQFAAAHLGLVIVTINPALRRGEIEFMLSRSKAKGIVMDRSFRGNDMVADIDALLPLLPDLKDVLFIDEWRDHLAQAVGDPPPSRTKPLDPGLIVFTSGTTGKPKAAILHHYGIVNNARLSAMRLGLPTGSTWLASLPMFHIGGTITVTIGALSQLSTQVIMPAFDPDRVLRLIERERINYCPLVPAMLVAMIESPHFKSIDVSSFVHVQVGGTTITPSFVKLVRQEFGCDVQVIFGQTECCGEVAKTVRGDPDEVIEQTVGIPYPGTAVKIVDTVTGARRKRGEMGEICLRSPFAAIGYFQDQAATDALFDDEGFLRTGDIGQIDQDGRIRMGGRLKEMIIRGGENIYPREIEDVLAEFAGIGESAVFGVPHPKWGEEVAVALRLSDPAIQVEDVRQFVRSRLSGHKVPKHWRVVADFPRNAFGKTQKFELQRTFQPD